MPKDRNTAKFHMFFRHPPGLYLIAFIGLWERFSLYGILAILVLFLSSPPIQQGFGWSQGEAIRFVAVYTAFYLFTPLVGGMVADKWLGQRRTLTVGAALMMAGHLLTLGPTTLPSLIDWSSGLSTTEWLQNVDIPLGQLLPSPEIRTALEATLPAGTDAEVMAISLSYHASTISFYLALLLIAVGGGFVSMSAYALIGNLYPTGDSRCDQGYLQFYFWTNIAALLAISIVGWFGEAIGWHYAFGVAGIGLFIGLVPYLWLSKKLLPNGTALGHKNRAQLNNFSSQQMQPLLALGALYIFGALFFVGYVQINSTLTLFAQQQVERTLYGFEIPAIWFRLVNAFVTLAGAPLLALFYARREAANRTVEIPTRFTIGLLATALTFALMLFANTATSLLGPALLLAMAIAALSIGELLILPTGPLAAYIAATPGRTGLVIAFWFLSMAVGVWIGGQIGGLIDTKGYHTVFTILLIVTSVGAVIARFSQAKIQQWLKQKLPSPAMEEAL